MPSTEIQNALDDQGVSLLVVRERFSDRFGDIVRSL